MHIQCICVEMDRNLQEQVAQDAQRVIQDLTATPATEITGTQQIATAQLITTVCMKQEMLQPMIVSHAQ